MRLIIPVVLFITSICIYSCTKIDSTVLGNELIPAVDNIKTFDTIIDVVTTNMIQNDDSTKPAYTDLLAVGHTFDPLFGTTDAGLYFEMKPVNFSPTDANNLAANFRDSNFVSYDSTVLCLRYSASFGDTTQSVTFDIFTLADEFTDTIRYSVKENPPATAILVGTKTVMLGSLSRDSIPVYRSTTFNYKTVRELRIPLDPVKFNALALLKDTLSMGSDVEFTKKYRGFAIKLHTPTPTVTGSISYFNISDSASKLEFFYRKKNSGIFDTTHTTFYFNPNNSGFADNIIWNRNGAEINQHLNPIQPDPLVYIKTTPGTATRIRIPGLENLSNRIVHRAELKMYQIPDINPVIDSYLVAPPLLYLERFKPGNIAFNQYQTIPSDLSPNTAYGDCFPTTSGIDYAYFGGFPSNETVSNRIMKAYTFNISRYVQQIITNHLTNADLRLTSNLYSQYDGCGLGSGLIRVTNNPISYGRVRLGGGNASGSNLPYKMRLRIIYSKL